MGTSYCWDKKYLTFVSFDSYRWKNLAVVINTFDLKFIICEKQSIVAYATLIIYIGAILATYDDVMKWKHFPRYWPLVRGIHRSPVNSPHKGQWRGALMFSSIYAWINRWVNNREAGDLRHHRAHYNVIVMLAFHFPSHMQPWTTSVDIGAVGAANQSNIWDQLSWCNIRPVIGKLYRVWSHYSDVILYMYVKAFQITDTSIVCGASHSCFNR